jgi:hypothetical protein
MINCGKIKLFQYKECNFYLQERIDTTAEGSLFHTYVKKKDKTLILFPGNNISVNYSKQTVAFF